MQRQIRYQEKRVTGMKVLNSHSKEPVFRFPQQVREEGRKREVKSNNNKKNSSENPAPGKTGTRGQPAAHGGLEKRVLRN